jgi:hypothetical protein
MRKNLLTVFLSVSFIPAFSQQDSLLQNFKFRVSHYRTIYIDINGVGQLINSEYGIGLNKSRSSSGNASLAYHYTKSTDKILLNSSGSVSTSFNSNKAKNDVSESRSKSFGSYLQFGLSNQWFTNKFFTQLGAQATAGFNSNKTTAVPGSSKNNQDEQSLAVTMGIGKGRLENVTNMQNALWLNKALTDENRLSRPLSPDELNELGGAITKANNTRILDSRKRTQFILELVDNYFQKKGLISSTDIRYFSNLNDILFYTFYTDRLSGTEKYVRLTPSIVHTNRNYIDNDFLSKTESRSTTKSARLSTGYSKYHPVSLKHQNNYGVSLMLNYISNNYTDNYFVSGVLTNQIKFSPEIKQAGINLFFEHAIYPSTRTIVSFNLQSEAGYQDVNQESGFFGSANLSASLNYFISYTTRLRCNLGAAYHENYYSYSQYLEILPDNFSLFANAGIEISL